MAAAAVIVKDCRCESLISCIDGKVGFSNPEYGYTKGVSAIDVGAVLG